MKIVFCDLENWEKDKILELAPNFGINVSETSFYAESVEKVECGDAEILSIFIHSNIDSKVLDKMPKLKLIVTRSTGYDHIDLEECKNRGIVVCNTPDYGDNTVAEFTMLLILALMRRLRKATDVLKRDREIDVEELRGKDLKGKTIGIIGAGRIGTYVAKLAKAFEMKVVYYDIKRNEFIERELKGKRLELEELLRTSDIISLHVPLTEKTYHMINKDNIKLVKKGALLINTARGAVVETEALIEALKSGLLEGAAVDVIEGEKILKREIDVIKEKVDYEELRKALMGHILLKFDNVIITPHIAYNTWEALGRILEKTLLTIKKFREGKELYNRIV